MQVSTKWSPPRWYGRALLLALVAYVLPARADDRALRMHLDCDACDQRFFRQELSYFDWVRNRFLADLAFKVVPQAASNGGTSYTITLRRAERPNIVRVVGTQASDQPSVVRDLLLAGMLRCLFEALRDTPHERAFSFGIEQRTAEALSGVDDVWRHWVIAPELLTRIYAETNTYYVELDGNLHLNRIVESSKFRSTTSLTRRTVSYVLEDDERVTGHANSYGQRLLYAHSIGEHWALGGIASGHRDKPANFKAHVHGGPVLEYNIFPYHENAERQLRFAYQVGAWHSRYYEQTVFGKLEETRPYHALSFITEVNRAWGSIQGVLQANSFLDRPSQWRLSSGVVLSVSVVAGLALQLIGEAAWINDQLELRERGLGEREIFLETVELESNFNVSTELGFSYTFGSIHNTIVNPRFGRVDLEEE